VFFVRLREQYCANIDRRKCVFYAHKDIHIFDSLEKKDVKIKNPFDFLQYFASILILRGDLEKGSNVTF
jgi:hypothetical protein